MNTMKSRTESYRSTKPRRPVTRGARGRRRGGSTGGGNGWLIWIGVTLAGFVLLFVVKLFNKSRDDQDVKAEMIKVVHHFPNYSQYGSYYDELVERCHAEAFEAAYSLGGRHEAASLDAKIYLINISSRMAGIAQREGKQDVADLLWEFNRAIKQ
jgi:hypothetical protein